MNIGARLTTIAAMVPHGLRIADIGTDHAYLPIALIKQGIAAGAIASDVNKGPYLAACDAVRREGMQDRIDVRMGDGLSVIGPGEADAVIIAGMGGATIIDILQSSPRVVNALSRLILQPMVAADLVRRWLAENGWIIADEALALEDGKLYQIIAAEQGKAERYDNILFDIGPVLWRNRDRLLGMHIDQLIGQNVRILAEMSKSEAALYSPKYEACRKKLAELEARKQCL